MPHVSVVEPSLPLVRYRFRFAGSKPEYRQSDMEMGYLGSAWRGVFGHTLRKAVCVTKLPSCDSCMLLGSCVYPWLFESRTPPDAKKMTRYPRTPGPFVLEPSDSQFDGKKEALALGVILFGQANRQLPYVVHALEQAGHRGLTSRRAEFSLCDVQAEVWSMCDRILKDVSIAGFSPLQDSGNGVEQCTSEGHGGKWVTVYRPGQSLSVVQAMQWSIPACPPKAHIRLITPLRIRQDNRLVNESNFSSRRFASVLVRRISMLTHFFGETPLETDFATLLKQAESLSVSDCNLQWKEWTRYSSRQKRKMQMGGLIGWFSLEGAALCLLWPYLWLGQWAHAGRNCSMGLGRYVVEWPAENTKGEIGAHPNASHWPVPLKL